MAFIHRNDVIQQISSAAFNPTLRHTILPRAFEGGSDRPDLHGSNSYGNLKSVLPVPVKDQKLYYSLRCDHDKRLFPS